MKKTLFILLAALSAISFHNCKFDLFTDLSASDPMVEITSVENIDDIIYIKGSVTNEGQSDVFLTGFCYAEGHVPGVKENQILFENEGLEFEAVIDDLWPGSEYYFKAFAANSQALGVSSAFHYVMVSSKPPVAPCTLTDDVISFSGTPASITYKLAGDKSSVYGNYEIELRTSSFYLTMYFAEEPGNGIYTVVDDHDQIVSKKKNVYAVYFDGSYYGVQKDAKVYITNNGDTYTVSFCDLSIMYFGSPSYLKGKSVLE